MPKWDLNKIALNTSTWVFSCKFAAYFQNTFFWEHLWVAASGILRFFLKLQEFQTNINKSIVFTHN